MAQAPPMKWLFKSYRRWSRNFKHIQKSMIRSQKSSVLYFWTLAFWVITYLQQFSYCACDNLLDDRMNWRRLRNSNKHSIFCELWSKWSYLLKYMSIQIQIIQILSSVVVSAASRYRTRYSLNRPPLPKLNSCKASYLAVLSLCEHEHQLSWNITVSFRAQ